MIFQLSIFLIFSRDFFSSVTQCKSFNINFYFDKKTTHFFPRHSAPAKKKNAIASSKQLQKVQQCFPNYVGNTTLTYQFNKISVSLQNVVIFFHIYDVFQGVLTEKLQGQRVSDWRKRNSVVKSSHKRHYCACIHCSLVSPSE